MNPLSRNLHASVAALSNGEIKLADLKTRLDQARARGDLLTAELIEAAINRLLDVRERTP